MATTESRLDEAQACVERRQYVKATKLLKRNLHEKPDHIESLDLLAQLALKSRKFGDARELLEQAVKIWPRSARLYMNLGVSHHCLQDYETAIGYFTHALSLNKHPAMIYYHLGLSLAAAGKLNDAGHSFQRALLRLPDFLPAHEKLAEILAKSGHYNAAVKAYRKALELAPERTDLLVDLGSALRGCDNDAAAVTCFQRALEINPRSISAMNNWANALRDAGKRQEAHKLMTRAIALSPNNAVLQNGYALACEQLGQVEPALQAYAKALELTPNYRKALYNRGGLEQELGDLASAEKSFADALRIEPDNAETEFRAASLKLLQGDFPAGWGGYERRWEMEESRGKKPAFDQPAWDGGSLDGKAILVYTEQGFGDTLQFVRYLPLLKSQGATVLLLGPPRLRSLLSRCEGIDQLIVRQDKQVDLPEFDCHVALASLPGLLGTTVETIPASVPYLKADPDKVKKWREQLGETTDLRVGIGWQGRPTYVRDLFRSIPLAHFAPLAETPGVQLISLQKGPGSEQLEQFPHRERVLNLGPEMDQGADGFEDTAAVIQNLDLVITSDTAVAHLAGGLGAQTWVVLQHTPEWRWLLDRADSPWYPTAKLFRQPAFGDWEGVFAEIREQLQSLTSKSQPDA